MHTLSSLTTSFENFAVDRFGNLTDDQLRDKLAKSAGAVFGAGYVAARGKLLHIGLVDRRVTPGWRKFTAASMPLLAFHAAILAMEYRRRQLRDRELDFLANPAYARWFISQIVNHARGHDYPV